MIKSMTGYGRAVRQSGPRTITAEIKSVNHRFYEFAARVPRSYGYLEEKLKSFVQSKVSRGKVEMAITVQSADDGTAQALLNEGLCKAYVSCLREFGEKNGVRDDLTLSAISRLPDVFVVLRQTEDEDAIWEAVRPAAEEAVERFIAMRETEGQRLKTDLLERLDAIRERVLFICERSPQTVAAYRERLAAKIAEILQDRQIDEARILTEAAIFADRVAVDEETVRLQSHLSQFRDILEHDEPVGRKLDFLVQEMNREANTIGSKAQDVPVAQAVVEIKANIEKIREQIQNIE